MPKQFTDEVYHKMLPKKQVGTAVIFLNTKGELLIVKPDYREEWLIPGGSVDQDESPLKCAIRETREEIGLDVFDMRLVGVLHSSKNGIRSDSLKFIFFGGILNSEQITEIRLEKSELEKFLFKSPEEAVFLLSPSLQKSIPKCLDAIKESSFVYIDA